MPPNAGLIAFINVAHLLCHYCLLILPTAVLAMAAQGGAFGREYGPILALATGMFVLYGVFSLPQGWLAARFGRRRMIAAYFFGTGAALVASAAAPTPLALELTLAAAGAFAAIYHPLGTAMLVEAAGDRPGRALGVNGMCGNAGVALAPVITAAIAARFGWQAAFAAPGLLFLGLGAAWLRLPPPGASGARAARAFVPIPRALVRRAVAVLLLVAAVSGLVFNAFTLLVPKLMQERLDGHALPLIGTAAFGATLCGALAQFTVGRLIDRTTLRRLFLPVSLVVAPGLLTLAAVPGWAAVPVAGLVAAALFAQVTLTETMAARYVAPELRERLYSFRFFIGFLGAAAAAPVVGLLHGRTGSLAAPTAVLAAFSVATLGCALFFPDRPEELNPELWAAAAAAPAE